MLKIKQIDFKDFELQIIPKNTEVNYGRNHYEIVITEEKEVRMSYYLRDIYIYKDGAILTQGIAEDVVELNLYSPTNRFLFIPFANTPRIYDLKQNSYFSLNMTIVRFNQFDQSERFALVGRLTKYQVVDLLNNKLIYDSKDDLSISGVRVGNDNTIWTMDYEKDKCVLKRQSFNDLTITSEPFPTPFEFFNMDIKKYRSLQEPVNYNLWVPEGSMLISSSLNKWKFVATKDKNRIIYRTVLPVSVVGHKDINTPYCKVDYFYIEIKKE